MEKIPTFNEMLEMVPAEILDILEKSAETKQSPSWHPEGDVLKHINIVYNRARETGDLDLTIAALFHDLGKNAVTKPSRNTPGSWSAHGHEFISTRLVDKYQDFIESLGADFDKVREVVNQHMRIKQISEMKPQKRKALQDNPYYEDLCKFTDCDNMLTLKDEELDL